MVVLHPQSTRERKRRGEQADSEVCRAGGLDGICGKGGRVETRMQPSIDFGPAYCYAQAVLAVVHWVGRAGNSGVASVVFFSIRFLLLKQLQIQKMRVGCP